MDSLDAAAAPLLQIPNGTAASQAGFGIEDVLANSTDAFVVLDRAWRIVYANRVAARLNRKTPEQLVGRTCWEAWPALVGTEVERQYRHVMEDGVPARFEFQYQDAWLEIDSYPFRTDAGRDGAVIQYRDITERKRTESELLNNEQHLEDFVENAAFALHWVGPDGTILWANEAELRFLGYASEEY